MRYTLQSTVLLAGFALLCGCSSTAPIVKAEAAPAPKLKGLPDTEAAIERLVAKTKAAPDDIRALCELAGAYVQRGRETGEISNYLLARETAQAALDKDAKDSDAISMVAYVSTIFHEFDKAANLAGELVKEDPQNANAYGILTDSALELGKYDKALDYAQKMMDLRPNLGAYSRAAQIRWAMGDTRGAMFMQYKAVEAGGSRESSLWARVQMADMQYKVGAYAAAKQEYDKVLSAMPDYRLALAGRARVRVAEGDFNGAEVDMAKALANAKNVTLLHEHAVILDELGRTEEGQQEAEAAAELMNEHLSVGIGGDEPAVARVWLQRGVNKSEALRLMEIEAEHHNTAGVFATLAWARAESSQMAEAVEAVEKALKSGVKEPWILKRCGLVLQAAGKREKGGALIAEAKALCPSETAWKLL